MKTTLLSRILVLALLAMICVPVAAADTTPNCDSQTNVCTVNCAPNDYACPVWVFISGIGTIIATGFWSVASVLGALIGGVATSLITPLFSVPAGFFNGLSAGFNNLALGTIGGAGDAMRASWQTLDNALVWTGPLAPLLTWLVIMGVVLGTSLIIILLLRDDEAILPNFMRRMLGDPNEEE